MKYGIWNLSSNQFVIDADSNEKDNRFNGTKEEAEQAMRRVIALDRAFAPHQMRLPNTYEIRPFTPGTKP